MYSHNTFHVLAKLKKKNEDWHIVIKLFFFLSPNDYKTCDENAQ